MKTRRIIAFMMVLLMLFGDATTAFANTVSDGTSVNNVQTEETVDTYDYSEEGGTVVDAIDSTDKSDSFIDISDAADNDIEEKDAADEIGTVDESIADTEESSETIDADVEDVELPTYEEGDDAVKISLIYNYKRDYYYGIDETRTDEEGAQTEERIVIYDHGSASLTNGEDIILNEQNEVYEMWVPLYQMDMETGELYLAPVDDKGHYPAGAYLFKVSAPIPGTSEYAEGIAFIQIHELSEIEEYTLGDWCSDNTQMDQYSRVHFDANTYVDIDFYREVVYVNVFDSNGNRVYEGHKGGFTVDTAGDYYFKFFFSRYDGDEAIRWCITSRPAPKSLKIVDNRKYKNNYQIETEWGISNLLEGIEIQAYSGEFCSGQLLSSYYFGDEERGYDGKNLDYRVYKKGSTAEIDWDDQKWLAPGNYVVKFFYDGLDISMDFEILPSESMPAIEGEDRTNIAPYTFEYPNGEFTTGYQWFRLQIDAGDSTAYSMAVYNAGIGQWFKEETVGGVKTFTEMDRPNQNGCVILPDPDKDLIFYFRIYCASTDGYVQVTPTRIITDIEIVPGDYPRTTYYEYIDPPFDWLTYTTVKVTYKDGTEEEITNSHSMEHIWDSLGIIMDVRDRNTDEPAPMEWGPTGPVFAPGEYNLVVSLSYDGSVRDQLPMEIKNVHDAPEIFVNGDTFTAPTYYINDPLEEEYEFIIYVKKEPILKKAHLTPGEYFFIGEDNGWISLIAYDEFGNTIFDNDGRGANVIPVQINEEGDYFFEVQSCNIDEDVQVKLTDKFKKPVSITVISQPLRKSFMQYIERIDMEGLKVKIKYDDGTYSPILEANTYEFWNEINWQIYNSKGIEVYDNYPTIQWDYGTYNLRLVSQANPNVKVNVPFTVLPFKTNGVINVNAPITLKSNFRYVEQEDGGWYYSEKYAAPYLYEIKLVEGNFYSFKASNDWVGN